MTVILMVGATASAPEHHDARAVLRSRGQIASRESYRGRADIVVGELPAGSRTIPPEIAAAARESMAAGIVLWANEPLMRPVMPIGAGNVVLVSTSQRAYLLSALDILLGAPASRGSRQALHRQWWSAWVLGTEQDHFDAYQADSTGATFVQYGGESPAPGAGLTAAQLLGSTQTDARRSSLLREALGTDLHLVHLSPGGGHWLVHWASHAVPLWLYSSLRMPARWSVSATLATGGSSFVRIPAFPGDLMISAAIEEPLIAELLEKIPLGALDVLRALETLVRRPTDWGFVIEAR
jgi:hypothetical protein